MPFQKMGGSFESFPLSLIPEELSSIPAHFFEQAHANLTGQRDLPVLVDKNGVEISAKGYQYDWTEPHELLWNEIVEVLVSKEQPSVNGDAD